MDLGWFEISLNVQDLARSVSFYETVGFRRIDDGSTPRVATLKKADCRIALYQGHLDPARPQLIFWQGDVAAIAEDLTAKGLRFEKAPAGDHTGTGALLLDPDGHPLYFVNIPGVGREDQA